MARLLLIHHTPSPFMAAMFDAVVAGASDPQIEGVELVRRPALSVTASDVLEADGYLLGSPANLGRIAWARPILCLHIPTAHVLRGRHCEGT